LKDCSLLIACGKSLQPISTSYFRARASNGLCHRFFSETWRPYAALKRLASLVCFSIRFRLKASQLVVPLNSTKASKGQMVSAGMRWHQMVEVWNEMSLLLANTVLPERLHIRPGQFWPQWNGAPKVLSFSAYNFFGRESGSKVKNHAS